MRKLLPELVVRPAEGDPEHWKIECSVFGFPFTSKPLFNSKAEAEKVAHSLALYADVTHRKSEVWNEAH